MNRNSKVMIKKLSKRKQKIQKELSFYNVPLKILKYSSLLIYLGIAISIVFVENLWNAILILMLAFLFLKVLHYTLNKITTRKNKELSRIDQEIYLMFKL